MKAKQYLSHGDIAEMMNKNDIKGDRRKVSVYYKRGYLPEPDAFIGTTPGWKKETIEKWILQYKNGEIVSRRHR